MDDIGFLGEISEDKEQEKRAVIRLYVHTEEGYEIVLAKHTVVPKVPRILYIPSLNRTIHRSFVGTSPDSTDYYSFRLQNLSYYEYEAARYEFVDGGWGIESNSRGEE